MSKIKGVVNQISHHFLKVVLCWLLRLRILWGGAVAIGLGVVLGQAILSPSSKMVSGLVFALPYLILNGSNPVLGLMVWVITEPFLEGVVNIPLGAGVPDLSLSRLCVGTLFTLLMAQVAIRRREISPIDGVDIAGIFFILGMVQSVLNLPKPIGPLQIIIDSIVVPLLAYFIAKNLVSNQRDLYTVLILLTVIGTFIGLYAIYEQTTGHMLFLDNNCAACLRDSKYSANIRILRGLFGGPGTFAFVFTQLIPVSFVLLFRSRHQFTRFLYGMAAVILITGNYFSFRRTGWIAMVVSFLVLQWFYPQFRKLFFILMLIIIPVAVLNWERITESEVYQDRVQSNIETANGRTEIHGTMLRMWQAKPIFGWGYAEYVNQSGRFRRDGISTNWNDTQSLYWKYLVSGGLAAFLPFLGIIIFWLMTSVRLFRLPNGSPPFGREFIAVFWASLAAYLTNNYTATEQHPFAHLLIFVIAGALVGAQERLRLLAAKRQTVESVNLSPLQPAISVTNQAVSDI